MILETKQADDLSIRIYGTRMEMGMAAARDASQCIARVIGEKGEANIVFAAAPSQNEFLQALKDEPVDWARVNALHMDEYFDLPQEAPQRFGNFLRRAIFDAKPFRSVSYMGVPGLTPQEICQRYAAILKAQPPDIVFLGIGENGHLTFNDPGEADFQDPETVRIVDLDEACRRQQVNDGCFAALEKVPLKAITLTIPALMGIPHALCIVPGPAKAEALYRTVRGPVSEECPASILRTKKGAVVYTDADGGRKLRD